MRKVPRLLDTMSLVQRVIQQTEYHLNQAQVEASLARQTAIILSSSTTRSALYAYTWWDWMFRGCVIASAIIFTMTLVQCWYFRHIIHALKRDTKTDFELIEFRSPAMVVSREIHPVMCRTA